MTRKQLGDVFSSGAAAAWRLGLVVALIVSATLNAVSTLKAMTRTDEILTSLALLQQQMTTYGEQVKDNRLRINSAEKDIANARERLAGLEGSKGPVIRASAIVP